MLFSKQMFKTFSAAMAALKTVQAAISAADLAAYPEFAARMTEIATDYNIATEWMSYQATTTDTNEYNVTLIRLTRDNTAISDDNPPVLLLNGIYSTPMDWFYEFDGVTNKPLAFSIADAGYDVWVGFSRGEDRSASNPSFSSGGIASDNPDFFNFSYQDVGLYDVKTMVNKIVQERDSADNC